MALFLGLYFGHVLGDFVFQPGRLVIAKRAHQSAAILHSAIVTACTALALWRTLGHCWPAVLIAGIAHLGVEQLSIGARRNPETAGLTVFLLDQGLHVLALALIAMFSGITVDAAIGPWAVPIGTLATACAVSTVAFGGSILVFEVQSAVSRSADGAMVLSLDFPRVYGMAERGAALVGALLAPAPALGALAFVPRIAYALFAGGRAKSHQLTALVVGMALALAGWAMVSSVIYLAH